MKQVIACLLGMLVFVANSTAAETVALPGDTAHGLRTTPVSQTGPANVTFFPADVEETTANQFNVVGHGLQTGDGPYRVVANGGTLGFTMTTWTIAKQVYAIRISDDEFSLTDTVGGSALIVTSAGDAISYTLTKMSSLGTHEIPTSADTTGTLIRTAAYPCTVNNEGKMYCLEVNAAQVISEKTSSHPNPAIRTRANGFFAGSVTTADGSIRNVTTDGLRYAVRNMYPTLVGTIGTAGSGANNTQTRVMHSHADSTRMAIPMTVVVSTPAQDTGTDICALDGLTCVFVEETVPPVAGVLSAWTWQACGTDLTDTNWARAYCSTVTDP